MKQNEIDDFFQTLFRKASDLQIRTNGTMRRGQCIFNVLCDMNIAIATLIRGGVNDCFYLDEKIEMCTAEIERLLKEI